jgi:glutathione S-transferase
MFNMTPEAVDLLLPYQRLKAWLGRMRERPSMQNTTLERLRAAA